LVGGIELVFSILGSSKLSHSSGLTRAILSSVETVLGLIGVAIFIVCVVALAAGVTWVVVRLSPAPGGNKPKPQNDSGAPTGASGG
jgi:hypothetical protein